MSPEITKVEIVPYGFPCSLRNCNPGLFFFKNNLGFKSEYEGDIYVVESGEQFWGGTTKENDRMDLIVQPAIIEINFIEEAEDCIDTQYNPRRPDGKEE